MDPLFHFIFPLIAILAARITFRKHSIPIIIAIALSSVLLDVDHFFGLVARGTFHNLFVTVLLPVSLLALSFHYGTEKHRQISIALLIVLTSHIALDMFSEGAVYLAYPLSAQKMSLAALSLVTQEGYYIISSSSIGLLVYFAMLSGCFFLEDIDFFLLKRHISLRYAIKDALRKEERSLLK
jgi:membrane-bound metal-dependent hydrolase YbcI (DUF457 family)